MLEPQKSTQGQQDQLFLSASAAHLAYVVNVYLGLTDLSRDFNYIYHGAGHGLDWLTEEVALHFKNFWTTSSHYWPLWTSVKNTHESGDFSPVQPVSILEESTSHLSLLLWLRAKMCPKAASPQSPGGLFIPRSLGLIQKTQSFINIVVTLTTLVKK